MANPIWLAPDQWTRELHVFTLDVLRGGLTSYLLHQSGLPEDASDSA